jgi:hypothetical protein
MCYTSAQLKRAWINFVEIAIAQQLKQVLLFSLKRNFLR